MTGKKLSRRDFLRMSALTATGAVLASCAPKVVKETVVVEKAVEKVVKETVIVEGEAQVVEKVVTATPVPASKAFTIEHWANTHLLIDEYPGFQGAILEQFKDKYPDGKVEWIDAGWGEPLRQNLVVALMGGTPPDIIVGESTLMEYAVLGTFLPIDDYVKDTFDNMIHACHRHVDYQGKTYGFAQSTAIWAWEANQRVLEEAGLDPNRIPETWDELIENSRTITEKGNGEVFGTVLMLACESPSGVIMNEGHWHSQMPGQTFLCKGDDCLEPYFNDPAQKPVFEMYRELAKYSPPGLNFNWNSMAIYESPRIGTSAYQVSGNFFVSMFAGPEYPDPMIYGDVPKPSADAERTSFLVGNGVNCVLKHTERPDECMNYLKMTQDDSVQVPMFEETGFMPITRTALEQVVPTIPDEIQVFPDLMLNSNVHTHPFYTTEPQMLWQTYNDLCAAVVTTDEPIDKLMDEAQMAAEALMG